MTNAVDQMASKNRLPIIVLLTANAVSMIGNNIGIVAIPWFVLETTGSAAKAGLVAFSSVLPTVIAALLGGALVDRFGNRPVSVLADLVSAGTVVLIPILYHTIGLSLFQLILLVFAGALLDAPGNTARMAIVPDLAEIGQVSLERANGFNQAIQSASVFIGPPVAGLLIAWLGTTDVLWLDAASFIFSAAAILAFVPPIRHRTEAAGRYLDEVREGLLFIRRDRFLLSMLAIGAIANFAGAPLFAVVLPVFARDVYGNARDLGLILGGVGAGSLLGAIAYGSYGTRFSRRKLAVTLSFISAAPVALLAFDPPIWVAVLVMAVSGFGDGSVNPLILTAIYERIPADLRGRVIGSMLACILAAAPIGMLIMGELITDLGIDSVILIVTGILLSVTTLLLVTPVLRQIDSPVSAPTQSTELTAT